MPIFGARLIVYPADSKISRSSGQSFVCDAGGVNCGVGAIGADGIFVATGAGVMFRRAGRAMFISGGVGAGLGVGVVGFVMGSSERTLVSGVDKFIFLERGRSKRYNPPSVMKIDVTIDM